MIRLLYRVSQEKNVMFWEVIVSVILSKELYVYMCPIPIAFRDSYFSVQYIVHWTDEQHAIYWHESQSELKLSVELSRMYCNK
jgi:hypothetical protein